MIDLETAALYILICAGLSAFAYYRHILDLRGSASAFAVGCVISVMGSILWLVMLLFFLFTSYAFTRYRFETKKKQGFHEGTTGERGYRNVLANGAVVTVIALLNFLEAPTLAPDISSFVFVSALAVAAADTAASEIGVFDPRPVLITNLKRVEPGTNGGISITGQLAAFIAAGLTSAISYMLFSLEPDLLAGASTILIPMLCGFFGCQVDSLIGATIENRGKIGKLGNNLLSIASGAALAWLLSLTMV